MIGLLLQFPQFHLLHSLLAAVEAAARIGLHRYRTQAHKGVPVTADPYGSAIADVIQNHPTAELRKTQAIPRPPVAAVVHMDPQLAGWVQTSMEAVRFWLTPQRHPGVAGRRFHFHNHRIDRPFPSEDGILDDADVSFNGADTRGGNRHEQVLCQTECLYPKRFPLFLCFLLPVIHKRMMIFLRATRRPKLLAAQV